NLSPREGETRGATTECSEPRTSRRDAGSCSLTILTKIILTKTSWIPTLSARETRHASIIASQVLAGPCRLRAAAPPYHCRARPICTRPGGHRLELHALAAAGADAMVGRVAGRVTTTEDGDLSAANRDLSDPRSHGVPWRAVFQQTRLRRHRDPRAPPE